MLAPISAAIAAVDGLSVLFSGAPGWALAIFLLLVFNTILLACYLVLKYLLATGAFFIFAHRDDSYYPAVISGSS